MPFKSKAQRKWMHMKHPKMAEEWEEHTPEDKKLPEHVSKHSLTPVTIIHYHGLVQSSVPLARIVFTR